MGITIAARSACILAALTQWPTAVPSVTTIRVKSESRNEIRPVDARRENHKVNRRIRPTAKPDIFTTANDRFTIAPAISLAFGIAKDLNTPNAAGAPTALKKSAAPNQIDKKTIRVGLIKVTLLS